MAAILPFPGARPKPPTGPELLARVRKLKTADSATMHWHHPHFQERLALRRISMRQVLDVIDHGELTGDAKQDQWGDWRIKIHRKTAGRRVRVVLAVKADHFVIITVM